MNKSRHTNNSSPPRFRIVRATPADAAELTAIAFAAKRQWGYPERWIEGWRDVLTIRPEFVADHETHVAAAADARLGFYAFEVRGERLDLVHMWVRPAFMGQGIGRALFAHAIERARDLHFPEIEIESDPNAVGFYERMGAERVGFRRADLEGEPRALPLLIYALPSVS